MEQFISGESEESSESVPEEFRSQAPQSFVSFINEVQRVAAFLCEFAEQRDL